MRKTLFIILIACLISCHTAKDNLEQQLSFGIIADCQYCNVEGKGKRKYALSEQKLQTCVDHFNTLNLSYVVHLGDFIDKDWESFDIVGPIYKQLSMPAYHVLGNHDFSVPDSLKGAVPSRMGLKSTYYHFAVNGWRFIVLNGNDISFHAYKKQSKQYLAAEEYYLNNQIESPKWNGAIGIKQMTWLEETLKNSSEDHESVIVFCHFPIFPENIHNLWNAEELISTLEKYACVKAYINGHNHDGNYAKKNDIHYLTLKGMVDTDNTSYGVMNISKNRMELSGYGREEDRILQINN